MLVVLAVLAVQALADPLVIVLSWDGMRHDYMDRETFPALERMEQEGVRAGRLDAVFPSSTFPGHVSMATGVRPAQHGIVDNQFLDRIKGRFEYSGLADWIDAEPIWITAERQGRKVATYFWVGSDTDWYGKGVSYRVAPFDSSHSEARRVDQILQWLDLPAADRPALVMSYWTGADSVGHRKGPDHPAVVKQIHKQDTQLARLLAGLDARDLWEETTLLLVSDHGMTRVTAVVGFVAPLREAGILFDFTAGASIAHIFLRQPSDLQRAEAIARKLPHVELLSQARLRELGLVHPTRTGDLVLKVEPPYAFGNPKRDPLPGMHGYESRHPDMGALFLAMGRGVTAGKKLDRVHQLDLVPTIAKLLSIAPHPAVKGTPIPLD